MGAPRLVRKVFDTPGTFSFTVPGGVKHVFAQGIGGGGAGGHGAGGNATTTTKPSGGGGGGSSTESTVPLTLVPGDTYDIIVGAGGIAPQLPGSTGRAGEDSRIQPAGGTVANELVCWPGGAPGLAGGNSTFNQGGIATREGTTSSLIYGGTYNAYHPHQGKGGYSNFEDGFSTLAAEPGYQGQNGAGGAAGGTGGLSIFNGFHGGGGGGGGAGGGPPGSNGGAAGSGGSPGDPGTGTAGSVGAVGTGFGSGGGGGGAGGCGSTGGGVGGDAGAGAPGRIILYWWE